MIPQLRHQGILILPDLPSLEAFTQIWAKRLQPGDVLALNGNLGSGKTTLTQHLARALGITEAVNSPTFVLMNEYSSGQLPLVHVDLYRLGEADADGLEEELLEIISSKQALVVVEWAEYGQFLDEFLTTRLTITPQDDDSRQIVIESARPELADV